MGCINVPCMAKRPGELKNSRRTVSILEWSWINQRWWTSSHRHVHICESQLLNQTLQTCNNIVNSIRSKIKTGLTLEWSVDTRIIMSHREIKKDHSRVLWVILERSAWSLSYSPQTYFSQDPGFKLADDGWLNAFDLHTSNNYSTLAQVIS
jgi:hypothetical protein